MSKFDQSHGGIPFEFCKKNKIDPLSIIDFSTSVNPYPLPHEIIQCFSKIDYSYYPERYNRKYQQIVGDFFDVPHQSIIPANGTTELIYALPKKFKNPAAISPVYGDYEDSYKRSTITLKTIPFDFTIEEVIDFVKDNDIDLLVIVNPSNPRGDYWDVNGIESLLRTLPNCTLCIDEAYQEMGVGCLSLMPFVNEYENIIVLRSLTKCFGVPGLRSGYGVVPKQKNVEFEQLIIPWTVGNGMSLLLEKFFNHYTYFQECWNKSLSEKKRIVEELKQCSLETHYGKGPYFLLTIENPKELRYFLLENFLMNVRDCTSFGLKKQVRIMPQTKDKNSLLIQSIKEYLSL